LRKICKRKEKKEDNIFPIFGLLVRLMMEDEGNKRSGEEKRNGK